jgi:hypothetical protein
MAFFQQTAEKQDRGQGSTTPATVADLAVIGYFLMKGGETCSIAARFRFSFPGDMKKGAV